MSKTQKVWLWVFLGMFVVPEVLWSPVYKMYYALFHPLKNGSYQVWRPNLLDNYSKADLWSYLLLLQFFGLLLTGLYLIIIRKSFRNKPVLWLIAALLLATAIFVLYLYGISTVSIKIL